MTKKWFIVFMLVFFAFQAMTISAEDAPDKDLLKKIDKGMKTGISALGEKAYDKAMAAFNEVILLNPEHAVAYVGLARASIGLQKEADAVTYLEKAIKLDPVAIDAKKLYLQTLLKLIGSASAQGQTKALAGYYVKIIEVPGVEKIDEKLYVDMLYQAGFSFSQTREYEKSNEYFSKLVALPTAETLYKKLMVPAHYLIGVNYSSMGKSQESAATFLKLLQVPALETEFNQLYLSTYYLIGIVYGQAGEFEKSNEYLLKFLELATSSPAHGQVIPMATMVVGANHMSILQREATKIQQSGAKDQVQKVAELAKNDTNTEKYLIKAIELNPILEEAYMHLGNYYYYCGDLDKTIETYQKLVDKFPASSQISTYKNFLESRKKDKEEKDKPKVVEKPKAKKASNK